MTRSSGHGDSTSSTPSDSPPRCSAASSPPGRLLGHVSRAGARHTGIAGGTPVTAGMTDGCAAQIAAGALQPGSWNSVLGTTLALKGVCRRSRSSIPGRRLLPSPSRPRLLARRRGLERRRRRPRRPLWRSRPAGARRGRSAPRAAPAVLYPLSASGGERFPFVRSDAQPIQLGPARQRRRALRRPAPGRRLRRAALPRPDEDARCHRRRPSQPDRRRRPQRLLVPAARRHLRSAGASTGPPRAGGRHGDPRIGRRSAGQSRQPRGWCAATSSSSPASTGPGASKRPISGCATSWQPAATPSEAPPRPPSPATSPGRRRRPPPPQRARARRACRRPDPPRRGAVQR